MRLRAHLQRGDEGVGQRRIFALQVPVKAPRVVFHRMLDEPPIRIALLARVGPRERGLDAVAGVVGKGQADRAGGCDRQQMRVADALGAEALLQRRGQARREAASGQVEVGVEQRERAALGRQIDRRVVGRVAHRLCDLRRLRARGLAVVAQAEHHQCIAQAREAQADAAFAHRFVMLLRQRPHRHVEHVVEHAHGGANQRGEVGFVERSIGFERALHEARQVDRAQAAAAVRRQRLFAAVVREQAVGIEGMNVGDRHVIDRLGAVRLDRLDSGDEAFAVEGTLVVAEQRFEPFCLACVGKADQQRKARQVVTTDHQVMRRPLWIPALAAAPVGHLHDTGAAALTVDRAGNAQAQQHALRGLQQRQVRLRKPHADALVLRALHRAVGVEQAAQQATAKLGRALLHRWRDGFVAGRCTERQRQLAQRTRGQAALAAGGNRPLPAAKVRAVRQCRQRFVSGLHDAGDARRACIDIAADHAKLARPHRQQRLVLLDLAIADQQADQIALGMRALTFPTVDRAVIAQRNLIARLQSAGLAPLAVRQVVCALRDAAQRVIRRQPQRMAFARTQDEHRLGAGGEEARQFGGVGLAIDNGDESLADQLRHLPRPLGGEHPGVGRHARIARRNRLAIGEVVVLVHRIEEQHARLGMVVGRAHDLLPQRARGQLAIDPLAVVALVRALLFQCRARAGAVHEFDLGALTHRLHEGIGHADRDVEVLQVALVLGVDEGLDVRVVAAQHAHLRAAARAGGLHRFAAAVEDAHVAHRARGVALRGRDPRALRADAREVVADATAAAHRLGRFRQRGVDAGVAVFDLADRIAHRLHEAVDQRRLQPRARGRLDAAGGDESGLQRLGEALLPMRALVFALGLRQRAGDAAVNVVDRLLVALGVLVAQHFGADGLRRQGGGRAAGFGFRGHGFSFSPGVDQISGRRHNHQATVAKSRGTASCSAIGARDSHSSATLVSIVPLAAHLALRGTAR